MGAFNMGFDSVNLQRLTLVSASCSSEQSRLVSQKMMTRPPPGTLLYRRKLNLKAKLESSISHFSFQALNSRRFQHGFHRLNLHRLTLARIKSHTSSVL